MFLFPLQRGIYLSVKRCSHFLDDNDDKPDVFWNSLYSLHQHQPHHIVQFLWDFIKVGWLVLHYIMVKTQSVPDLELPAAASASLWTPNPLHPNLHLKSQSTNTKNLWPSFGRNWSVRDSPNVNVPVVNCYLKKSIDLDSSGKAETLSGSFWTRHLLSRYSSTTALTQMSTTYDVRGIFCICLMKHRDLLCSDNTKETTITTITTATTTTTITTTTTTTMLWSKQNSRLSNCDHTNAKYVSIPVHFLGHCVRLGFGVSGDLPLIESLWLDWQSSITVVLL